MTGQVLVRQVRLVPVTGPRSAVPDRPVDVRIEQGTVTEVAESLPTTGADAVYDAGGRWAMPGLWDAHVHMAQWALNLGRLDLSGSTSAGDALARVRAHLDTLDADHQSLVTAFGHRAARWPEPPTVAALDAVTGRVPTVLISGDGHHGWLNTAALDLLRLPRRRGVVSEREWFDSYTRLGASPVMSRLAATHYPRAVAEAAARGVVGVIDMEWEYVDRWVQRIHDGVDLVRVHKAVYPVDLEAAISAGLHTGVPLEDGRGLVTTGPVKIISDGSLNTQTAHCRLPYAEGGPAVQAPYGTQNIPAAELTALLARATETGFAVAVHAIGDAALEIALDAFARSGAHGRIEHAQLATGPDIAEMARLGITASIQPAHVLDDAALAERCWPDRTGDCFAFRSLSDAGIALALGSDAPVSPLDPWLAIAAAVHRAPPDQPSWHPEQRLPLPIALTASTAGQGTLAPGSPADIVVLDADPLATSRSTAETARKLRSMPVAATLLGGRPTYQSW